MSADDFTLQGFEISAGDVFRRDHVAVASGLVLAVVERFFFFRALSASCRIAFCFAKARS